MDISKDWDYLKNFFLFAVMGSGANWVLATALFQEIPYLENHTPEGLCIATYMNVSTAYGLVFVLCYLYFHHNVNEIPFSIAIPFILTLSCVGSFFAAALYPVSVNGVSLLLFFSCFISGGIGSLSSVIMNPFMTRFDNNMISAARTGGSGLQLIAVLVALIQNPGSTHERFSPSVYLACFGVIFIFPLLAYRHIMSTNIGLRDAKVAVNLGDVELKSATGNSTSAPSIESKDVATNPMANGSSADDEMDASPSTDRSSSSKRCLPDPVDDQTAAASTITETWPFGIEVSVPAWMPTVRPYMLVVGFVNFNTWGMLSALTPFAIDHATVDGSSGSYNLAIAYELAAVCLVLGDYSTTRVQLRFDVLLVLFSIFTVVIYLAAAGTPGFRTPESAPLLIILYCTSRFMEAHLVTSTYRTIAHTLSADDREPASKAIGIVDQVSTVTGAVLSTLLVSFVSKC